jgi:arsenate reductase
VKTVKRRILFVCTGNAGRSQMAQALCCHLAGDTVIVESAGVRPWQHLHPVAVRLMAERGLDLSSHYPKPVGALQGQVFDLVITIGEPAKQGLPRSFPGDPPCIHWNLADPAEADGTSGSEAVFRATAEEIERRLPALLTMLGRVAVPHCGSGLEPESASESQQLSRGA